MPRVEEREWGVELSSLCALCKRRVRGGVAATKGGSLPVPKVDKREWKVELSSPKVGERGCCHCKRGIIPRTEGGRKGVGGGIVVPLCSVQKVSEMWQAWRGAPGPGREWAVTLEGGVLK